MNVILSDDLYKPKPGIMSHKSILALAISECLKESGSYAFASMHVIYVYRFANFEHETTICRIDLDDDYVRIWWSSDNQEYTHNNIHLAIDYCNPSLMDRILDTISTIKHKLTVKESQTEIIYR